MKIIIAGDGKVGLTLTQKLAAEGHDLTLIDSKQSVLDSSIERFDVMGVQGNCASMIILEKADVRHADLLIAATSTDEVNLLCCMTAHGLNPALNTIARIRNPEYGKQIFTMRDVYSLSLIINPEKQAAREIERLIKYPGFLQRDTFAKSRVEIVELRVAKDSGLCDVRLLDLERTVKCKVLVCAVSRGGEVSIPGGHFILREGDHVFITATSENLTLLLQNLGVITHKAKRVMICGGGRIGYYLAERLAKRLGDQAIITGESLGQVASQTIESITSSNSVVETLPVLRPLIMFDKLDIIEISKKIDTYDTSVLPYEDCCTVFLPKFPAIKPDLNKVIKAESRLDVEALISEALNGIEMIEL